MLLQKMNFEDFDDHTPDYQYEDGIPDLSDSEEDHEEEWKTEWRNFEMACRESNTSPLSAFGSHVSKISQELECKMKDLTDEMTIEEIKHLTRLIQTPTGVKPAPVGDLPMKKNNEPARPEFGPLPPPKPHSEVCTISLQKGLTDLQIKDFIIHINGILESKKDQIKEVQVITKDWPEPYHAIPAAKKLYKRYVEAGLAGCLIFRGYQEDAHKMYCIAYEKAKIDKKSQNIIFSGIDQALFKQRITHSANIFLEILSSKPKSETKIPKKENLPAKIVPEPPPKNHHHDDECRDCGFDIFG